MSLVDMPLDRLRDYRPERTEPADFDTFWARTLEAARSRATDPAFEPVSGPLRTVSVADVSFSGFAGQPIKGWFLAPAGASAPLPTVVEYIGYGGGRSFAFEWLHWSAAGYAHLVMDTRGQGSAWATGDTPDVEEAPSVSGQYPGFLTRGIDDPATYYYRRLIADAVMATEAVTRHPLVDPDRIVVAGASQGGGLALAVAGLSGHVRAAVIDVPFLCHPRRAIEITDADPYRELARYLATRRDRAERAFATLGYVDGCNFAARASAPAIFAVGLKDEICPPSTVFAAFNHYAGPSEIRVWPYSGHDAGEAHHRLEAFRFLADLGLAPA
jgi:cephalosporin-C deacetylase